MQLWPCRENKLNFQTHSSVFAPASDDIYRHGRPLQNMTTLTIIKGFGQASNSISFNQAMEGNTPTKNCLVLWNIKKRLWQQKKSLVKKVWDSIWQDVVGQQLHLVHADVWRCHLSRKCTNNDRNNSTSNNRNCNNSSCWTGREKDKGRIRSCSGSFVSNLSFNKIFQIQFFSASKKLWEEEELSYNLKHESVKRKQNT